MFVTVEDETGDVQLIVWPHVFARCGWTLGSRVILASGVVSRYDGTANIISRTCGLCKRASPCRLPTTGGNKRGAPILLSQLQ